MAEIQRELRHSASLLRATLESTADGILVVDREGRIVLHNERFRTMWSLTETDLERGDDYALGLAQARLRDPAAFLARVRTLYDNPEKTSSDRLELSDGRVFERYSRPQYMAGEVVGRVWSFRDVTEAFRTQEQLRTSEERYRRLFQESRHAVYLTREDGGFLDANPAAFQLFEVSPEDLPRLNSLDFYADVGDREAFRKEIARTGSVVDYSVRLRSATGRIMECLLTSTAQFDAEGRAVTYQGIIQDVSEQRRAEQALRESERKFRALIEHASDTITILDAEGGITYESPSLTRVLGYAPEDLVGENVFSYVHPDDRDEVNRHFRRVLKNPATAVEIELRFRHADGSWRWMDVSGRNLLGNPEIGGVVVNARDVTDRKEAEARLLHDAFHDKLTDLPNRALVLNRIAQLIRRSHRDEAPPFAVLFVDLDRFKVVNDSLSHMVGDQLLTAFARRLRACLRPGDTVARLGGDEFTMLLDDAEVEEATRVAERVEQALQVPFTLGEHEVFASVSMGIATSRSGYEDPLEMLRDADLAMYRAKTRGRGGHVVFDRDMHREAVHRLRLETDLRMALERQEFVMHYQPIVDLSSTRVVGLEALLRWAHPERGLVLPGDFLGLAEDTGLIVPIGWWVLGAVCEQLRTWSDDPEAAVVPVQVNVSAHQLGRQDLLDQVGAAIARHRCPPELLHLELTESTMMENAEYTMVALSTEATSHRPVDRRLRHGLLVSQLPSPLPDRLGEDRSVVHRASGSRRRRHRSGTHDRGPRARSGNERRRRRNRG